MSNDDNHKLVSLTQPKAKSRPSILECVQKVFKHVRNRKIQSMIVICVNADGTSYVDSVIPADDGSRDDILDALENAATAVYRLK